jgi:hypothetical protein
MAGTKISDLPSASALTGAELVPVVQSNVTKKTTVADILASPGIGTVTSVNVSGGTTGLTATGGPITTTGTITLGGTLDVDNGGTGATTAANARTNLDVPSRSGSGASGTWSIDITGNAGTVTNGVYTSGSYANPSWITSLAGSKVTGDISGNAANVTGTVAIANGGTGATTASDARTALSVPSTTGSGASGTWSIDVTGNAGTVTNGVYTTGSYSNPSWITTLAGSKITGNISGNAAGLTSTLGTSTGGTGQTTYTNGQLLIGNASGSLSKATLTAGSNVTITNGDGTITIAATGGGGGSGTVTSVDASGGTTGMTFSGGPITSSGTLTMAGTLAVANGGTNATTAANARVNLLPSYAGNGGKVLAVNAGATDTEWIAAGGTGTVTSVDVSGGSTGLTTSGGPITGAGTITIAGTLNVANGGTGVTSSSGANSVVLRDSNQNIAVNSVVENFTTITASGTPVVLTVSSAPSYLVSGSGGQTIQLPDATTLNNGVTYAFNNNQSSGAITVNNNSSTLIASVPSGGYVVITLLSNSTAAGTWDRHDQTPSNVSWSTNTFDYPGSITSATWNGVVVATNRGGTGLSSFTSGGAVYASSTSVLTTGTLPVASGGTGQTSYTDGQLLIGNTTGNTLTKSTLTAGSGISITNGSGSITIAATGGGATTASAQSYAWFIS